jgi:hypothetical protein
MSELLRGLEVVGGVFYLAFGIDGFLKKIPLPEPSIKAKEFLKMIEDSFFIFPTIKLIEIIVGVCFIFGFHAPVAWCFLSPIVFNILGYHFFINKKEILMPVFIIILHLMLFFKYFSILRNLWN